MKKILVSIFICISFFLQAQTKTVLNNSYFNQEPPADSIKLFAPGIISNEFGNRDMAISPDGNEIFYTMQYARGLISVIMHAKKINGKWSAPEVASFSGIYNDLEPAFSFDSTKLFFVSNRALNNEGKTKDYDIWFVTKENENWVQPGMLAHLLIQKKMNSILPSQNREIFILPGQLKEEKKIFCFPDF